MADKREKANDVDSAGGGDDKARNVSKKAEARALKKERSRQAKIDHEKMRTRVRWELRLRRAATVLVLLGVGAGAWFGYQAISGRAKAQNRLGGLVVSEPSLGREHIASTSTAAAPTSGNHNGAPVCGVQHSVVPVDSQIHALEHGAVAIQYRPVDLEDAEVEDVESLATEFGELILVAPNPGLETAVVATAWTRRMNLEEVALGLLRDFVTAYQSQGPETAACHMSGF